MMEKKLYFHDGERMSVVSVQTELTVEAQPYRETEIPYRIVSERGGYFVIENISDQTRFLHGLGRMGVMDAKGRVLVEPKWDEIEILPKEGPAEIFVLSNKGGYFVFQDVKTGARKTVNGRLLGFRNGIGQIVESEETFSLLSLAFTVLTCFTQPYENAESISYYNIDINGEKIGEIPLFSYELNENGEVVSPADTGYSDGLLPMRFSTYSYYDREGLKAFQGKFEEARGFREGLAVVKPVGKKRKKSLYGVIDTAGKWVAQPQYDYIDDYQNGYARVWSEETRKFGFLDKNGTLCVPMEWDAAVCFGEDGLAWVRRHHPPVSAVIDGSGAVHCNAPVDVEAGSQYTDGRMYVQAGGKTGYLDYSGGWAVKPEYDAGTDFHCGVALVKQDGRYYLINPNGAVLKELTEAPEGAEGHLCWTNNKVISFGRDAMEDTLEMTDWKQIDGEALELALEKLDRESQLRETETLRINERGDYIKCYDDPEAKLPNRLRISADDGRSILCDRILAVKTEDGNLYYRTGAMV